MKKLLIFHPTVAPYRVDFFNDLYENFETKIVLNYSELKSQKINCENDKSISYKPEHLKKIFTYRNKDFYKGHFKYLKEYSPDIVAVSEYGLETWSAIFYRLVRNKNYKIVTICDDSLKIAKECSGLRKISRNLALKYLDGIILCNPEVENWYKKNFNINSFWFPIIHKDEILENKIRQSDSLVGNLISKYDLVGKKVFIYVGRLAPEKNLEYLVESFIKASQQYNDIVLLMVGDNGSTNGQTRNNIEKIIEKNRSNNIILVGRKDGNDLYAFYNLGQVLILPSLSECFGAVTNEALVSGEMVMVSKNAGSSCLVDDTNGELIDINEKWIDFNNIIKKLEPVKLPWYKRKNKMIIRYEKKMGELCKWINQI